MSKKTKARTQKLIATLELAEGEEREKLERQLRTRLKELVGIRKVQEKQAKGRVNQVGVIKATGAQRVDSTTTSHRTHSPRFRGSKL